MKKAKMLSLAPVTLVCVTGSLLLGGCTWFTDPPSASPSAISAPSSGPGPSAAAGSQGGQPLFVIKPDFTPLYRTGPAQPTGPDQSLPKNTVVKMLKKGFGYSRVQLEGGLDGYVATDDLSPAPADLVTPATAAASGNSTNTEHNSAIVEHYSVDKARQSADVSTGNANAEGNPDLPEPRLEPEPTPVIKPEFRY